MSATYKGPDGRLYRVGEAPGIRGTYRIEYLDPACSVVYKQLPGYNDNANREEVVALLGKLAKDRGLEAAVEDSSAAEPLQAPALKGSGVWLYGDHRVMRVGIGSDTERSDARYYHVLILNLLANQTCWRKRSGSGNYDHKHIPAAEEELHEVLPEDAHELTSAEVDRMFMDGLYTPYPQAAKVWDEIMASAASSAPAAINAAAEVSDCPFYCQREYSGNGDGHFCKLCGSLKKKSRTCDGRYKDDWHDCKVFKHYDGAAELERLAAQEAEPQEIADESSDQDTPGATLTAAPATEIAAPAFDFSALGELAGQAAEDNEQFDLHWGRAQDEYLVACVYLARIHDLTARAGRYGGGTWTAWYKSKGISEGSARTMVTTGNGFKSATVADLKNLPGLSKKDLRLVAGSGEAQALVDAGKSGDDAKVKELLARVIAAEAAREAAERKTREEMAWRRMAEGQAEDAKAVMHDARQTAQEAQRRAKQAEVKVQEQENMLADLQDRLDDTTAQLRSRPVPAEVVDQDEIERRAAELAARKIAEAEARAAEAERSLCDVAILLKGTIDQVWQASGIDGLTPRSQDDDAALESLYQDLLAHVDALEVTMAPDCQDWEGEDE